MGMSIEEVKAVIMELLHKYNAEYAILFGSYARGDAAEESDIDVIVVGGERFIAGIFLHLARNCARLHKNRLMPLKYGR